MKIRCMFALAFAAMLLGYGCSQPTVVDDQAPMEEAAPMEQPAEMEEVAPAEEAAAPDAEAAPAIDVSSLAMAVDPVCKMGFEEHPPTATADYDGKTYGFCSETCKKKFEADPAKMLAMHEGTEVEAGAPAE